MKITTTIGAVAALGLLAAGFAVPAQAAAAQTVTSTVKNHADNGHGTPAHWADDTWTRTSTITPGDTDGTYTVHLAGKGTFATVKDAGSPNGGGATVGAKVSGDFAEDLTATVTGAKQRGATGLNNINNKVYDDKTTVHFTTTEWIKHLFAKNGDGATVNITAYTYKYGTGCETWTDANTNNDGQDETAGNITGKKCPVFVPSVLKAANKCRASKSDKRNYWVVSNQGPRDRTYWLHVSYNGTSTYGGEHSVASNKSATVVTSHGGKLTVGYYDGAGHHKYAYAWSDSSKLCK